MRGIKTIINSGLLIVTAARLFGASPDYFPLQVGNQWVFRSEGRIPDAQAVEVLRRANMGGRDYHAVRFFGQEAWLRMADDGTLHSLDTSTSTEKVWIPFGAEEGTVFDTEINPCNRTGRIESKSGKVSSAAGEFSDVAQISFVPSCADAGIETASFAPGVGPVQVAMGNIAGTQRYELVYARAGATLFTGRELSFGLTLDAPVYAFQPAGTAGGPQRLALARITLRSTHPEPLEITYSSGQTYELILRNERGDIAWRWSDGKAFTLALRTEQFGPGERNWVEPVPLTGLPEGRYVLEAFLVTVEPKQYVASVPFEIRTPR